jgi:hypothetical protein
VEALTPIDNRDRAFLSASVDSALKRAVIEQARKEDRSVSAIVRRALRAELLRFTQEQR